VSAEGQIEHQNEAERPCESAAWLMSNPIQFKSVPVDEANYVCLSGETLFPIMNSTFSLEEKRNFHLVKLL